MMRSASEDQYVERAEQLLAYLVRAGAGEIYHGANTLLSHLQNTQRILEAWGCSDDLCLAGLGHSVYTGLLELNEAGRSSLRTLIGPFAETLIYQFCTTPLEVIELRLLATPNAHRSSDWLQMALLWVASDLETLGRMTLTRRQLERQRHLASQVRHCLSPECRQDLDRLYRLDVAVDHGTYAIATAFDTAAEWFQKIRPRESDDAHLLKLLEQVLWTQATVLDLGCGHTLRLSSHFQVTAVDLSPGLLHLVRGNAPAASFVCADLLHLPFTNCSFDALVCYYTLIHIPRSRHALALYEIQRVLKPGGWALLGLGAYDVPIHEDHSLLRQPVWFSHYDQEENCLLLTEQGFHVITTHLVGRDVTSAFLFALVRSIAKEKA